MVNSVAKKKQTMQPDKIVSWKSLKLSKIGYILPLSFIFFFVFTKTAGRAFLAKLLPLVFFAPLTTNNLVQWKVLELKGHLFLTFFKLLALLFQLVTTVLEWNWYNISSLRSTDVQDYKCTLAQQNFYLQHPLTDDFVHHCYTRNFDGDYLSIIAGASGQK